MRMCSWVRGDFHRYQESLPLIGDESWHEDLKSQNLKRENQKRGKRLAAISIQTQEMLNSIKRNTDVLKVHDQPKGKIQAVSECDLYSVYSLSGQTEE